MELILSRCEQNDIQTLGELALYDNGKVKGHFMTLELPWKENERQVSCIPKGIYKAVKHVSPKFGKCLWLQDVPGRSEILIHKGNFYTDILGCILIGKAHIDINGDGHKDVTSSGKSVRQLMNMLKDIKDIEIRVE